MDVTIVSILPVHIHDKEALWSPGPLKLMWRSSTARQVVSDVTGRSRYTDPAVPPVLYRTDSKLIRYHRVLEANLSTITDVQLHAAEWLLSHGTEPPVDGFIALHFASHSVNSLNELTRLVYDCTNFNPVHGANLRSEVHEVLGAGTRICRDARRALSVVLIDRLGTAPISMAGLERFSDWDERDVLMAIANEQGRFLPDPAVDPTPADYRSAAYRTLAGRYGFGIVEGIDGNTIEDEGLRFWARGFFVDVVLLVATQEMAVASMQAAVEDMLSRRPAAADLQRLQSGVLDVQTRYFFPSFAPQGPYDSLLERLQVMRRLPESLDRLSRSTDQLGQLVQAQIGHDTNIILLILAILSFPLASALAVWQGFSSRGDRSLWLPVALLSALAISVILARMPVARRAFGRGSPQEQRR